MGTLGFRFADLMGWRYVDADASAGLVWIERHERKRESRVY